MGVVEPDMEEDAQNLRHEIAALSNALAQAKAREGELKTSRAEIERLTGELSAERATSAARHAAVAELLAAGEGAQGRTGRGESGD